MRDMLLGSLLVGASILAACGGGGTGANGSDGGSPSTGGNPTDGGGGEGGEPSTGGSGGQGGSPSTGGNPTNGGGGEGGEPTTGGSGGQGGSPTNGGGGQGGGPANCTEITAADFTLSSQDGSTGVFVAAPGPGLGAAEDDRMSVEFYGSAVDPAFDGEATGVFDLGAGTDANYATCSRCVRIVEDPTIPGRTFFQSGGTLNVDAASDQLNGNVSATFTNVTLVEVTIDPSTFTSTPVIDGECLHLASATIEVMAPVVPMNWACDPTYYADGLCDCGCVAPDTFDCADATVGSCDYCDDTGSCSTTACPGTIDPVNNAACTGSPPVVPMNWSCDPTYYNDGFCDCGCVAPDHMSDCADATVGSCDYCDDPGSCSTTACPGTISPANNAACTP